MIRATAIAWRTLALILPAAMLGCSTATDTAKTVLVDAQGSHAAGFIATHPAPARPDGSLCRPCHGDDLRGGISRVSCFSVSFEGRACHAGGPAFHPPRWLDKAAGAGFHGDAYKGNALINGLPCAGCHDPAVPSSYNCLECHFNEGGTQRVPTGSAYIHGSIGGHAAFGPLDAPNATTSVCMNCHATNNRFGHMPQPFCHNCHAPAPPSYHPAGWGNPDAHGPAAKAAPGLSSGFENCRTCHGSNFSGGSVGVPCFTCHGVNAPHSERPWRISGDSTRTHTNVNGGNAPVCFFCHAGGAGSPLPPPPTPPPGTPPGCFNNTLCHGAVGHAVPFLDPDHLGVTQPEFDNVTIGCARCHAVSEPSPVPGVPACRVCHTAGSPLHADNTSSFGDCSSCHGSPPPPFFPNPQPNGTTYPNVAGAHAVHLALDNVWTPVPCEACHDGLGFVTQAHYDRANARPGMDALRIPPGDLAFDNTYHARTGPPSFDNLASSAAFLTCSNVSCHGGQVTPNWQTGAIDPGTQCASCHQLGDNIAGGSPQYNVYYSGGHKSHVAPAPAGHGVGCSVCHDVALLAPVHFDDLSTPAMTQARATINITALGFDNSVEPPTCNPSCHTVVGRQSWLQQPLP